MHVIRALTNIPANGPAKLKRLCWADLQWKQHAARPECGNDRLHEVWPRARFQFFFLWLHLNFFPGSKVIKTSI